MTMRKPYVLAVFALFCVLLLAGCPKPQVQQTLKPLEQETQTAETETAVLMNGTCVFFEGTVSIIRAGSSRPIEIGDEIIAGDTIKTEDASVCELQFGGTAKLQLQALTVLEVTDILLSDVSNRVAAKLEIGSILNKVQKLSGTDSYTIRTGSTVCGVRGTEFVVKVDSSANTSIAVKKGRVAALPATEALESIIQEASTNAVASAALEALVAETPVIEENQQLVIDQQVVAAAEIVHKAVKKAIAAVPAIPMEKDESAPAIAPVITFTAPQIVDSLPVSPAGEPDRAAEKTPAQKAALQQVVQAVQTSTAKPVVKPKQITAQFTQDFKDLDSIQPPVLPGGSVTPPTPGNPDKPINPVTPATPAAAAQGNKPAETTPTKTPATEKPALEYKLIPALKRAVSGNVVRSLAGNAFIVSDKNGTVTAVSDKGVRLWVVNTENKGTERSYAVPFKDLIYFSGSDELVIIDAKTGKVVNRIELDANRSHMLGNRVVPFPNAVVFPTKSGLDVLSPTNGEVIRSIEIPGGSMMTPANYDGKAVIVSQKGVLYIINIDTGTIEKEIKTKAIQPTAQSPKLFKKLVCFADRKGLLVMVNLEAGTVLWEKQLEGSNGIFNDVEIGQEGVFAFGNETIFAFSLDGAPLFAPVKNVSAPPALIRGVLVYTSKEKFIYAIDAVTGNPLGKLAIEDVASSRPLFFEGSIFVGLADGSVLQVEAAKLGIKK